MAHKRVWIIWLIYVLLWTTGLLLPGSATEIEPLDKLLTGCRFAAAKSLHVCAYAVMTILSAFLPVPARFRWILVFFLMAHATVTELLQENFIPMRSGELDDVGFDQLGITLGILLSWKRWVRADP
ncbi:MAG: VanZ family protein [Planctomycetes bacterium]|nr:VanZ family protein [Planctomycetota bacterium]